MTSFTRDDRDFSEARFLRWNMTRRESGAGAPIRSNEFAQLVRR